jgi:ABC-type multidrug transport system fused ATPase/permease subunit
VPKEIEMDKNKLITNDNSTCSIPPEEENKILNIFPSYKNKKAFLIPNNGFYAYNAYNKGLKYWEDYFKNHDSISAEIFYNVLETIPNNSSPRFFSFSMLDPSLSVYSSKDNQDILTIYFEVNLVTKQIFKSSNEIDDYNNDDKNDILNSFEKYFNLKIKAGQSIALVGHTGSGKSTLVNLISRFYEPVTGQILIDGVDYKERSIHFLHKRLGYVLQSPVLFSTTIMENIRYGNFKATDEEIINASKLLGADEFISKLEKGYDSYVGEGGNLLSNGQKQLLSFVRAIIADPRILILDEATSSVDSETEKIVQNATSVILKGRTNIIVAHRLSTIVSADTICMMENGKIIEIGTHSELLSKRGAYFELYKAQFMQEKEEELVIQA